MAVHAHHFTELRRLEPAYTDEISLFDLWDILVRRKWWLLLVFALTLAMAAAYLATAPRVYEARAVLRLASVAGEPLRPAQDLAAELTERYRLNDPAREHPYISTVKAEGARTLELQAEAQTAQAAVTYLRRRIAELTEQQQQDFALASRERESHLQLARQRLADLNGRARMLEQQIKSDGTDDSLPALLILERASMAAAEAAAEVRVEEHQTALSPLGTQPPTLIRAPEPPPSPSQPRTLLIVALAVMLGLMLGVITIFVVEFLSQANKRSGRQLES